MYATCYNTIYYSTNVGYNTIILWLLLSWGWSGGAKVLGKLPVPGRPTILITVGQGSTVLAVDAGGGGLDIFTLICPFSSLSPSLWKAARYRLKYCLKGPLNPKQPTKILLSFTTKKYKRNSFVV